MADNFPDLGKDDDQVDEEDIKNHGVEISITTLKQCIKAYGLRRREPDYDVNEIRAAIDDIVDGYGSSQGYRAVWHTLQLKGLHVPRIVVQEILKEIDPEGTEMRKSHILKRRSLVGALLIWALEMEQWQLFKLSSETLPTAIDTYHRPVINILRHGGVSCKSLARHGG
ncbi:Hypothetical predicted protein [Paramuricea clavata]|uniref:Uncharacterized protein n=1 Tax=Paramuricea clavata TaxID=317549 RepID=A0A7D9I718_PARCT|nr:Hypothetical predicted protein [Paramuricea clavata]